MIKLQKIKNAFKKALHSGRFQALALMLMVGTAAAVAQNTAGNYEAGTTALSTVATEIAKYVPIVVKLCYAIAGVVAIVGAISVYRDEQRGTGRQEEDYDDSRRLHLPYCRRTGTASVLRSVLTNADADTHYADQISPNTNHKSQFGFLSDPQMRCRHRLFHQTIT